MAAGNERTIEDAMLRLDDKLTKIMPRIMQRMGARLLPTDASRRTVEQQWEDFRAMTGADMVRLVDLRGEAAVRQYMLRMLKVFAYRRAQEITHGD